MHVIFTNVVLVVKHGREKDSYPTLGDNMMLGAGVVILRNINIGNNVNIGANSVNMNDIFDDMIVVGVPGKCVGKKGV